MTEMRLTRCFFRSATVTSCETEAVRLERDVKGFVKGLVKLRMNGREAIALDWKRAEGKAFVQGIYETAYRLLGGGI